MTSAILVATFQDYRSARQAARELAALGISEDMIHVDSDQKTARAGSVEQEAERESHPGFVGWWQGMFGAEEHAAHRRAYQSQLESGRAILRATVPDELVDSAVNLLNRNGATAIEHEQPAEEGQRAGWRRAEARGGVRVYSQNSPVVKTRRPATGMSPRKPSNSPLAGFGTTPGTGTLAGDTTTGLHDQDFTPEYRQNFEKLYRLESGTEFDSMRPAYEFGHRTALDTAYRGRPWSEVEKDVRARWERDHPSMEWGRAKDAIQYGWQTVSEQPR